jgi:hypothetical protein
MDAPWVRIAVQLIAALTFVAPMLAASILPSFAFNKDAFPNRQLALPAGPNQ